MRWQVSALGAPGALVEALPDLWRADPHRSPFCAPAYLEEMAELARGDGAEPLVAVATAPDGAAAAAWPLRRERDGTVRMLHGEGADHGTCIARDGAGPEALGEGLAWALQEVRAAALFLKNIPSWGPTLDATRRAVAAIGWKGRCFAATPCPVLRVPEGAGAADALHYLEALAQGQRAFGVVREGRVVQVIVDCVTARRARGQGLYAKVLRAVRATLPPGDACLIYTNDWNTASQRGILKAGFAPAAIRERRKRQGAVETRWLPAR